jgi:type IV secretory pathway VirJ component
LLAVLIAVSLVACAPPPARESDRFDTGRLGHVRVREPSGDARAVIFLFSEGPHWSDDDERCSERLGAAGAVVLGVDLGAYRAALDASDGECLYLLSEIESLSQQVQRALRLPAYYSPILAGAGEAGALVYAALTQTPAATVAGAVSVDPPANLATRLPLCPGAPASRDANGFAYGPATSLPGFWSIGFTNRAADAGGTAHVRELLAAKTPGEIVADGDPATRAELLARLVSAHFPSAAERGTAKLPLVELPARAPSGLLAFVLSGDGGWRDLDKTIAENLRERGVNVVGWDSLRYFWHRRTPDDVARDLNAAIERYAQQWDARAVALIGYSFGADVLPFAYNRLPNASRALVEQVSLLGFSPSADFQFHVTAWLGAEASSDALPTLPEVSRISPELVQCFYGRDEEDSLCPELKARGVEVIETTGGHHFDGDYPALAARILTGFQQRAAAD